MSKARRRRNRRIAVRRTPKPSSKAICVAYDQGVGRMIGCALIDVSLFGARLSVEEPVAVGSEVAVGLQTAGEPRPDLVPAAVIWCKPFDAGHHIGVHFRQPLSPTFFQAL